MDVKEYISTGVLELYAMGATSSEEGREVEKMCATHPEIAEELASIIDAIGTYAAIYAANPDPGVRAELMEKIRTGKNQVGNGLRMRNTHELTYKYLIAACIASLIISTFASVFFYQKWSEAEDRYVAVVNEKNVLTQNMNVVKDQYAKVNHDISVMRDPAITTITLRAADSSKYYKAHLFWNKYTRQVYLDISELPTPPAGMQYQLWAVAAGIPVDAGVFQMTSEPGMQKVKPVSAADSWAVTLEPIGGSMSPAMDQVYLVSQI